MGSAQSGPWQSDYPVALRLAAEQQKPLVVVLGQGINGWQQVTGGALNVEARHTLNDEYVCCYVDTASSTGREVARQFGITTPTGLVISDRTGNLQAFWHEGYLSADAFAGYLHRYADPQRPVFTTDTNAAIMRTSYYPPTAPSAIPAFPPASYLSVPMMPAMQGGVCRT